MRECFYQNVIYGSHVHQYQGQQKPSDIESLDFNLPPHFDHSENGLYRYSCPLLNRSWRDIVHWSCLSICLSFLPSGMITLCPEHIEMGSWNSVCGISMKMSRHIISFSGWTYHCRVTPLFLTSHYNHFEACEPNI